MAYSMDAQLSGVPLPLSGVLSTAVLPPTPVRLSQLPSSQAAPSDGTGFRAQIILRKFLW